jgi:hypothetical protein
MNMADDGNERLVAKIGQDACFVGARVVKNLVV